MKSKRILILHDPASGPLQLHNSVHNVVTCANTGEALSILMGACSAFGKEDYAKTGKVRPEVLLLDSSYLENYEGFELLEIIRKYYSLQSVKIFILDKNISEIEPAVYSRYKISGKLPVNCNLDALTEISPEMAAVNGTSGAMLSTGIFSMNKDWFGAVMNIFKAKSLALPALKTVAAGKVAVAASCMAVATGFVAITGTKPADAPQAAEVRSERVAPQVKKAAVIMLMPEDSLHEEAVPEPAPAVATTPSRNEENVKKRREKTALHSPTVETVPALQPRRDFKIRVVEDDPQEDITAAD